MHQNLKMHLRAFSPAWPGPPHWSDLNAGLCVAGLLLPEAVAYAGLAHLPVAHAMVAMLAGLCVYALYGGSRFAMVAPTSSSATLAAAAVLSVPHIAGNPGLYAPAFFALVLCAGGFLLMLGMAQQGQIAAFVSRPVLRGFAFALGVTIVIRQLPDALGLRIPPSAQHDPVHILGYVLTHGGQWHAASASVALGAATMLALLSRFRRWPGAMLTLLAALAGAAWLDLPALGVAEVGPLATPTFQWAWPRLALADWLRMGELGFGLVLIVFAESWGSMRSLALSHGDRLDANRELRALGLCNIATALLQGLPVGAGFSASHASVMAGASSRWTGVAALTVVTAVILFALPGLHVLPRPVLAVVVMHALLHALNPQPLINTWQTGRDRIPMVGAALAVVTLGVLDGMLVGVALSLLTALHRFSVPVVHELGELPGTRDYVIVDGRPHLHLHPKILVLRPEEPLFFANADRVCTDIFHRAQAQASHTIVVLSLEESSDLDSTALEALNELDLRLNRVGKRLVLSRAKDAVRALLHLQAPNALGHESRVFWSVADAVDAYR